MKAASVCGYASLCAVALSRVYLGRLRADAARGEEVVAVRKEGRKPGKTR